MRQFCTLCSAGLAIIMLTACVPVSPLNSLSAAEPKEAAAAAQPLLAFDKPVTIVCLGDSVTGVYYHTGGRGAYPEMLELALKRVHSKAQIKVINAGISGHTTANGLARLDADVLSKKPDLVTISFGLNDVTRVSPEDYRKNLIETINRCRAINAQVVLCTPNAVINTGARPQTKVAQYCEILRQVGRELKAPVCDQFLAGEAHRQRDPWGWRLTLSDEIHPNMDGHKLMAEELCHTIAGKEASLADVGPLAPALTKTVSLLKQNKPVRVLAMSPYDELIAPALKKLQENAQVEVTTWKTAGKSLAELEKEANETVRKFAPNLVLLTVPRDAATTTDEEYVRAATWIMNWSLSFGHQEWDCVVVHPNVTAPESPGPRDDLLKQLIRAQHLHFIDRQAGNKESAVELFNQWFAAAYAEASKAP
ncbi:MAG: SGNH/GDSL hydrolase family protein [Planctomycetota bacterium]